MLLEIAKPIALLLCILSLCAVFHAAFLVPASDVDQKISSSLQLLVLAAGISLIGGMIFRESSDFSGLMSTLPMRLFCWAAGIMLVLFLVAWYLESNSIFEGHVHF